MTRRGNNAETIRTGPLQRKPVCFWHTRSHRESWCQCYKNFFSFIN